ncbi:helix-turn-helix domain-containing protein [Planomonospora sp. ID67723]|uniref:helix-turn-helix transcriptional regulator n=1 Tax=Planomonospora sp. ID67723 TaxID=2738134 RepID=UPI0018C35CD3|nr:helix-turn-helix transcriptional regulator [Planomonospora sp. ID67723]MBG0831475.1 helix-turn-helix domain-containing protein [Planomonospora sp. ID67723]
MSTSTVLRDFLRSRRAQLRPQDVGLPDSGRQRRVAGLRREEIAELADVSVDYYTRMEQGRVRNASPAVLDALARALRLDQEETRHLHRIARPPVTRAAARSAPRRPQRVRPMLRTLLASMEELPCMVMGRRMDVLAWNRAASALFGDFDAMAPAARNIAKITFLSPDSRALYADWESCARRNVAYLGMEAGRHPDDPELAALIGELAVKSPEFRTWWAEHPVQDKTSGILGFHHPIVGSLELSYETLRAVDDPTQALISYAPEPGSPSEDALRLLLAWTAHESTSCAPTTPTPRPQ